jgi:hypothetical protein
MRDSLGARAMTRKRGFVVVLVCAAILLGLDRFSYYTARNSLYHAYPGLADAPVAGGGRLVIAPDSGVRVAWFFNYYQRFDIPSRGNFCETAQMWVSLTGQILETYPKGPGVADWIRCIREDAS